MPNCLKILGISETEEREKNDFYATDPKAMYKLLEHETFNQDIWEPACGEGNLSEVLKEKGYNVYSTDLIDRGYANDHFDFLKTEKKWQGDIITNPPFKLAIEFVKKSLECVDAGNKIAMFLKLNYICGVKRYNEIYSTFPPQRIYAFVHRVGCAKNNDFVNRGQSAMDYAWFVWEKGKYAPTELKWIK